MNYPPPRGAVPVNLSKADLRGADLSGANLSEVNFREAHLEGANLSKTHLDQTDLREAYLERAILNSAYLEGTDFSLAHLKDASFIKTHLKGSCFREADLERADLRETYLEGADLTKADLKGSNLRSAHLEKVDLCEAHFQGANLEYAHLEGADLLGAHLEGTHCCRVFFDAATRLNGVTLSDEKHGSASLADISWDNVNLAVVDWGHLPTLGDERVAHQKKDSQGKTKDKPTMVNEYKEAVRANRQLAVVLRNQGLNEEADRFAYRAQVLQRVVLGRQRRLLKYLLSWFLYLIAGYGYRPLRTVIIYLLVIGGFAIGFYEVTHILHAQPYPLAWYEALILSVSSFHGRGFFQPVQSLGDPVAILASLEAIFGLLIEISFIATFTQRFFGK